MEKEKKKKIVLCSSLITLVIVATIVMLTGGIELRKNNNSNNIVERNLGDTTCESWTPTDWGDWKAGPPSVNQYSEPTDSTPGTTYIQVEVDTSNNCLNKYNLNSIPCYREKTWTRTCNDLQRAVITCKNPTPTYTGSSVVIATCSGGSIQNGNKVAPGNYAVSCDGDSTHTDAAITYCNLYCPAGSYKAGDKCESCPLGYYNSAGSFTCTKCGDGMTTTSTGTELSSECKPCPSDKPYEVDGVCQDKKPECKLTVSNNETMRIGDLITVRASSDNCNVSIVNENVGPAGEITNIATAQTGRSITISLWGKNVGSGLIKFKATSSDEKYSDKEVTFSFSVQKPKDICDLIVTPSSSTLKVGDTVDVTVTSSKCTISFGDSTSFELARGVAEIDDLSEQSVSFKALKEGNASIIFKASDSNGTYAENSKTFYLTVGEYKCYCNSTNNRCTWGLSADGYIVQSNISSEGACTAYSTSNSNACFKNSENKYVWGSYGATSGYKYVVASDKTSCEAKNSQTTEEDTYVLTCPSTTLSVPSTKFNVVEEINCTFLASNDANLTSASSTKSSVATAEVNGTYVKVKALKAGTTKIQATANNGKTTNEVTITVLEEDSCKITSVTTESTITSITTDGNNVGKSYADENSYYIVYVDIEGLACKGERLEVTATNSKSISPSDGKVEITRSDRKLQYAFHVYPNRPCESSRPTATLSTGDTEKGNTVTHIYGDWVSTSGCFKPNGDSKCTGSSCYGSFLEADTNGRNVYYSNWDSKNKCYNEKWTRGACGADGTYACYANNADITLATGATWATSSSTTYPYLIGTNRDECKASACYVNSNKTDYQWVTTDKVPAGYTKATGILAKNDCKEETPACYKDSNNIYHWGNYKTTIGYTLIPSVAYEKDCKAEGKCYKKGDDYKWSETALEGYTEVENAQEECRKDEESACYLYNGNYVWGNYSTKTGYTLIGSIEEEQYCVKAVDACYLGPDNKYHVGDYSLDNEYSWVEESKCGSKIDVPPTASSLSNVIYIAMAILAMAGIGFVYYANVKKQKNN